MYSLWCFLNSQKHHIFFKPACRIGNDTNSSALRDFFVAQTSLHQAPWKFFAWLARATGWINSHKLYLTAQSAALRAASDNRTTKQNKHVVSFHQKHVVSFHVTPKEYSNVLEILQTVHWSFTEVVMSNPFCRYPPFRSPKTSQHQTVWVTLPTKSSQDAYNLGN